MTAPTTFPFLSADAADVVALLESAAPAPARDDRTGAAPPIGYGLLVDRFGDPAPTLLRLALGKRDVASRLVAEMVALPTTLQVRCYVVYGDGAARLASCHANATFAYQDWTHTTIQDWPGRGV